MRFNQLPWLFSILCLATQAMAGSLTSTSRANSQEEVFPIPPLVQNQTDFWIKAFLRYESSATIIHDPEFVDVIIDVIDFENMKDKFNNGRTYYKGERRDIINRYVDRYQLAINRLQKIGKKALEYGAMEQRVLQVYSRRQETLSRLFTEEIYLRTQQGLADEFPKAAERADRYLPYMERIFANKGLPVELTRIVFVESMFNKAALSKVGASGVWQFMPDTARLYMTVNGHIDERLSPLKATYGAAELLESNYRLLKSWPLAVTAYNHGPGGMQKAARTVGSTNLDDIIRRYQAPSFGFASRNFYSEFLAARHVYKTLYQSKAFAKQQPLKIDHVRLDRPTSVDQLLTQTPLNRQILEEYNHCLLPKAFESHRYQPLPAGFELIVPVEIAETVRKALKRTEYSQLPTKKRRS